MQTEMLSKNLLKKTKILSIYILALFYIIVGFKHFTNVDFFLVIVPPYLPFPEFIVYLSGVFEIVLGFLIIPNKSRKYAAFGLILLLIAVFPANIYLYNSEIAQNLYGIDKKDALIRLPFQIPLIIISYWHSLINSSNKFDLIAIFLFFPTIIYFLTLSI